MKKVLLITLIGLLTFTSCNNGKTYEKRQEFSNYTWNRLKPLIFEIPMNDTKSEYNVYFTLRHITQYPYDNLKTNFTIIAPSGDERTTIHEFEVKNAEGKLMGEGAGDLWDLKLLVKERMTFNESGTYKFQIDNLMDYFDVVGLVDFGVIVEKASPKKEK
jgi:gliding motility-associated lipoprotein GldH